MSLRFGVQGTDTLPPRCGWVEYLEYHPSTTSSLFDITCLQGQIVMSVLLVIVDREVGVGTPGQPGNSHQARTSDSRDQGRTRVRQGNGPCTTGWEGRDERETFEDD